MGRQPRRAARLPPLPGAWSCAAGGDWRCHREREHFMAPAGPGGPPEGEVFKRGCSLRRMCGPRPSIGGVCGLRAGLTCSMQDTVGGRTEPQDTLSILFRNTEGTRAPFQPRPRCVSCLPPSHTSALERLRAHRAAQACGSDAGERLGCTQYPAAAAGLGTDSNRQHQAPRRQDGGGAVPPAERRVYGALQSGGLLAGTGSDGEDSCDSHRCLAQAAPQHAARCRLRCLCHRQRGTTTQQHCATQG